MRFNPLLAGDISRIANLNHSESTWTLGPRLEIGKTFGGMGTPGVSRIRSPANLFFSTISILGFPSVTDDA